MINQILKQFDLKWWTSLEAQQKLTVGMALIIFALCGVCAILYRSNEKNKIEAFARHEEMRLSKNIEIASEKARGDACYESQLLYLKENEQRYQELFFNYQRIKNKINDKQKP